MSKSRLLLRFAQKLNKFKYILLLTYIESSDRIYIYERKDSNMGKRPYISFYNETGKFIIGVRINQDIVLVQTYGKEPSDPYEHKHPEKTYKLMDFEINLLMNEGFFGPDFEVALKNTREKYRVIKPPKQKSEEARSNIRKARLGRRHSVETLEKMRLAALGRKVSEETKRKISATIKGRKYALARENTC